jgi:hypothetical protein
MERLSMNKSASGMAIASLVLGIVSWVMGLNLMASIPGAILGKIELDKIKAGDSAEEGRTFAKIGYYASLANIAFFIFAMFAGCLLWLFMFGGLAFLGLMGAATS